MYKPTVKVWVKGQELELYTIGHTAKLLKRSVETVRAWERDKIIPRPLFKYKNNVRLYHPKEVEVMRKVIRKYGKSARKDELQKTMWAALTDVRKEILGEPQSEI